MKLQQGEEAKSCLVRSVRLSNVFERYLRFSKFR